VEQRHNILLMTLVFIVLLSTSDFDAQKKEQDSKVDQQRVSWLLCATNEYTSTMGHFTFWLRPWLNLLAEPKTTLSRR